MGRTRVEAQAVYEWHKCGGGVTNVGGTQGPMLRMDAQAECEHHLYSHILELELRLLMVFASE